MRTPLELAWSVLKADARQIYDGMGRQARQTMNPNAASMADREERRLRAEAVKREGLAGHFTDIPEVRTQLMGRPRNEYSEAAVSVGSRNHPTEGGPENELKLGPYDGWERRMYQRDPSPVGG